MLYEHGNGFCPSFIWKIYFYNFNEPSRVFNVLSGTLALLNLYVQGVFFSPCLSSCLLEPLLLVLHLHVVLG